MAATSVSKINPHISAMNCPDALRNLQGWLVWRYEHPPGATKPRKVPYYTNGGRRHGVQGRPEDRNQMTHFEAARAAAARGGFDGVGLALMPEFGIVALDFDKCMAEGGVHPDVESLVAGTYAEYSPSGEGVRAFMRGQLGNGKSNEPTWPYGFETFSSKGFVTFTGNRLEITDMLGAENSVSDVTEQVRETCTRRFGERNRQLADSDDPLMAYEPPVGLNQEQIRECLDVLPKDLSYDEWLAVGMAIHHETQGEGFAIWDAWSQESAKYSSLEYNQGRWDSFGKGGHRPVTARSLVKLAREHGAYINTEVASAEEFEAISEDAKPLDKVDRFQVVPAGEFSRGQAPSWIIKGLLPKAELGVLFGESGSGKSFIALDMACSIARGEPWRGLRTRSGRVVYIAAEGGGGFRKRLQAYGLHHQVDMDQLPFGIIHAAPNFLQKTDALDVSKAIVAGGKCDVVIVDTFAQVIPGANENAAEDIGKALAHCKGIHRATGAMVILVHHSGKDSSKGSRGWSGLRAAADAEIEVVRTVAGRYIRVSKQKDGDDQGEWGFDLQVVPVGIDEDGDVIDSCVAIEAAVPVMGKNGKTKKMGEWEQTVYDVVSEFAQAQSEGIEMTAVLDEVVERRPKPENGKRDTRRQLARRALLALSEGDDSYFMIDETGCVVVL